MGERLGRTTHPLGGVAGAHRGLERGDTVTAREGVPGEVGGRSEGRVVPQRLDTGSVQLEPLRRQEVVGDGLRKEGVAELVADLAPRLEDMVLDRGAQRRAQGPGVDTGDALEEGVWHPATDDRGDPHDALGRLLEAVDPGEQEPCEIRRIRTAALVGGHGELLGEEGVALGPVGDVVDHVLAEVGPGPPHDATHVGIREGPQLDAGERGQSRPQGEGGGERMTAVDVVAAVGGEEAHPVGAPAREEKGEELPGRLVGPVDVLDDDDDRSTAAQVGQCAVHCLDEVGAHGVSPRPGGDPRHEGHEARVVGDELVDEVALPGVEGREHLDEREVRQGGAHLPDAVADEGPAVGRPAEHVPDEGGLPDAGVAGEEDRPGAPVVPAEGVEEPVDLLLAADELGGGTGRHGPDHGTGRRRQVPHGCRGAPEVTLVRRGRAAVVFSGPPTRRATKAASGCAASGRDGRSRRWWSRW